MRKIKITTASNELQRLLMVAQTIVHFWTIESLAKRILNKFGITAKHPLKSKIPVKPVDTNEIVPIYESTDKTGTKSTAQSKFVMLKPDLIAHLLSQKISRSKYSFNKHLSPVISSLSRLMSKLMLGFWVGMADFPFLTFYFKNPNGHDKINEYELEYITNAHGLGSPYKRIVQFSAVEIRSSQIAPQHAPLTSYLEHYLFFRGLVGAMAIHNSNIKDQTATTDKQLLKLYDKAVIRQEYFDSLKIPLSFSIKLSYNGVPSLFASLLTNNKMVSYAFLKDYLIISSPLHPAAWSALHPVYLWHTGTHDLDDKTAFMSTQALTGLPLWENIDFFAAIEKEFSEHDYDPDFAAQRLITALKVELESANDSLKDTIVPHLNDENLSFSISQANMLRRTSIFASMFRFGLPGQDRAPGDIKLSRLINFHQFKQGWHFYHNVPMNIYMLIELLGNRFPSLTRKFNRQAHIVPVSTDERILLNTMLRVKYDAINHIEDKKIGRIQDEDGVFYLRDMNKKLTRKDVFDIIETVWPGLFLFNRLAKNEYERRLKRILSQPPEDRASVHSTRDTSWEIKSAGYMHPSSSLAPLLSVYGVPIGERSGFLFGNDFVQANIAMRHLDIPIAYEDAWFPSQQIEDALIENFAFLEQLSALEKQYV